jgi:hypothetical protein
MLRDVLIGYQLVSFALFFALLLSPEHGRSEEVVGDSDLPTYIQRARWSEDWSVLNDPDSIIDHSWLPLKYFSLNEDGTNYLSLGGEYRLA